MIELKDIEDRTDQAYLKNNREYANQLVATLNQVNGFSSNKLIFFADSKNWTYDYYFNPNYEINKKAFVIGNDQIKIRSTNRDDLLNSHYYQLLMELANKHPFNKKWQQWFYFPQDQVLQVYIDYMKDTHINIKLTKPIDQYDQKQINAMGKLMTNICNLITNDDNELDSDQFDDQWEQAYDDVLELDRIRSVAIVFDLNNFANPNLLVRWWDGDFDNCYENDYLKQKLKDNSPLLEYLESNDFQTNFLNNRTKLIKS